VKSAKYAMLGLEKKKTRQKQHIVNAQLLLRSSRTCFALLILCNFPLSTQISREKSAKITCGNLSVLHTNRLCFGSTEIIIAGSKWPDKNIPPLANHTLMIPPHIRGPTQDDGTRYFPHAKDTIALSRKVVHLCKQWIDCHGYTNSEFNQ
jgi:hypothetical protein